jgi:hypothetical protein
MESEERRYYITETQLKTLGAFAIAENNKKLLNEISEKQRLHKEKK